MSVAPKLQSRVARENDLYSITYTQLSLVGSNGLSARAARYLQFLVSVIKCGYTTIISDANTISDAIFRAQGQTRSVRTLRYALSELEDKGYISRPHNRGGSHFKTVIYLNVDRFAFWTKIKTKKVIPIPTHDHNSGYVQKVQTDDRRNQTPCFNSQYPDIRENEEQRAGTRSKPYANHIFHPIIFTLRCLLWGKPDMGKVLSKASREIAGYSSESGIDWGHWTGELWRSFPTEEREGIARVDFLPRLRNTLKHPPPSIPQAEQTVQVPPPIPLEGSIIENIRKVLAKTTREELENKPPPEKKGGGDEKMSLDERELALLTRAKKTIKYCR